MTEPITDTPPVVANGPDGEPWDQDRSMATIKKLRIDLNNSERRGRRQSRMIAAVGESLPPDLTDLDSEDVTHLTAAFTHIAAALGVEYAGDPAPLLAAAKTARLAGPLAQAIHNAQADPGLTARVVDLSGVDVSGDISAQVSAAVDAAIEAHPALKVRQVTAAVSGSPFPAGSGGGQAPTSITADQMKFMSPEAIVAARRAGLIPGVTRR